MSKRKVLLLEPNYKNKYPPMGLMKLATYYRCRRDDVRFYKGDLKDFAARLLFEEMFDGLDMTNSIDKTLCRFVAKRGADKIIEHIRTGKHAPINLLVDFSSSSSDCTEQSLNTLLNKLLPYRNRYKTENYPKFDRVGVTTLFTFYWKETIDTINFAKKLCKPRGKVYVGGIAASLVPNHIEEETGIAPHVGLLNEPFAYDTDKHGNVIIDELPLDYSILEEIDYRYPTEDAYFGYMTRGCVNNCPFCAVNNLEPTYCKYIEIKEKILKIKECFGAKRNLLLMDNNVFASECFDKIVDEIRDCGFHKGATYVPINQYDIAYRNLQDGFKLGGGRTHNVFNDRAYIRKLVAIYDSISERLTGETNGEFYSQREALCLLFPETATKENIAKFHETAKPLYDKHFKQSARMRVIDFNQGLDGRLADASKMKRLAEIEIRPLRIAFDFWELRDKYVHSIRTAAQHGIRELSNYLLYNFNDHPDELYNRLKLNIELCEELGVTIYSFPMKYHPIDDPTYFRNRDYVGKHWNRKFIRSVQAVLNSTHGKIGRGKTFFEAAFGADLDEFHKILWMPEALIIQRYKYDAQKRRDYYGSKPTPYDDIDEAIGTTTDEWWAKFNMLTPSQRICAKEIIVNNHFGDGDIHVDDVQINEVLKFYQIKRDES
jgi:hypothetical protein